MTRGYRRRLMNVIVTGVIVWIVCCLYGLFYVGFPHPIHVDRKSARQRSSVEVSDDNETNLEFLQLLLKMKKIPRMNNLLRQDPGNYSSSDSGENSETDRVNLKQFKSRGRMNSQKKLLLLKFLQHMEQVRAQTVSNSRPHWREEQDNDRSATLYLAASETTERQTENPVDDESTDSVTTPSSPPHTANDIVVQDNSLEIGKSLATVNIDSTVQMTDPTDDSISVSSEYRPDALESTKYDDTRRNESADPGTVGHTREFVQLKNVDERHIPFQSDDPGENGNPVLTASDQMHDADKSYKEYSFNDHASSKISLERSIPDTRNPVCRHKMYNYAALPKASIIMCFIDESWSALLRSVHSVVNRSPPELIAEILLVDDFSQKPYTHKTLDEYINTHFKPTSNVKVMRLSYRHGLIRARMAAVKEATADVVIFLDSHIECNVGWLEPLLAAVAADRKTVASPIIDTIELNTFQYVETTENMRGGFNWNMQFIWQAAHQYDSSTTTDGAGEPIKSPAIAGGLLAIDRQWFHELGEYDPGLDVWGAENLELSLKTWMCGGQLLIIPCSRVGHLFRSKPPYSYPGAASGMMTVARNTGRVVDVWLDEYAELFFRRFPYIRDLIQMGPHNIRAQHQLRANLRCHSFSWYLDNVYRELYKPSLDPVARGSLRHHASGLCMDIDSAFRLSAYTCLRPIESQYFQLTEDGRLEHVDVCLGVPAAGNNVMQAVKCENKVDGGFQLVVAHEGPVGTLRTSDNRCVTVGRQTNAMNRPVLLVDCREADAEQIQWSFSQYLRH